jgi:hypothetical protein
MHGGGGFWKGYFRDIFVFTVDLFAETLSSALPSYEQIKTRADMAESKVAEEVGFDPAEDFERALDAGVAVYETMDKLRQGLINLFAVGLFHMFEQQMFEFYRRGLYWGYEGRVDLGMVQKKISDDCGVDVARFDSWSEIKILKLVANCAKHSEGRWNESCAALRAQKPEFFEARWGGERLGFFHEVARQPLAGDGLYLDLEDFGRMAVAVKSFWTELGEAIADQK